MYAIVQTGGKQYKIAPAIKSKWRNCPVTREHK